MRPFSKDSLIAIFEVTVISESLRSYLVRAVNSSVAVYITANDDQFDEFYKTADRLGSLNFDTWGAMVPFIVIMVYDRKLIPILDPFVGDIDFA